MGSNGTVWSWSSWLSNQEPKEESGQLIFDDEKALLRNREGFCCYQMPH